MKKLHPNAFWLFFIKDFIFVPAIFIVYGFFTLMFSGLNPQYTATEMFIVTAGSLIFIFFWSYFTHKFYKYELKENGVNIEFGIINKKYISIPYNRIQNINIQRGIIERLLGISLLQIETAGSNVNQDFLKRGINIHGAEGTIPGISKQEAELLREELILRSTSSKNQPI